MPPLRRQLGLSAGDTAQALTSRYGDKIVVFPYLDVRACIGSQSRDRRSLRPNDPRECRSRQAGQETDCTISWDITLGNGKRTMRGSLSSVHSGLKNGDGFVQILLFAPDDPVDRLIPLRSAQVVLPDLPVALPAPRFRVIRIDSCRLCRVGRASMGWLGRRGLRDCQEGTGVADLVSEGLLVRQGVVVFLGNRNGARCLIGSTAAAGMFALRPLNGSLSISRCSWP
jgi:hypothetical protein